jgi:16S rRNA (guanine966-N2)-methyltransferase
MRIIGGTAAGRILKVPKGHDVRPTPDLVRQAIFNSLGARVEDTRVLELFAGTGALTLECLSRGATTALCIEKSQKHAQFIRENLAITEIAPSRLQVRIQDAMTALAQLAASGEKFSLVLADPPYGEKNVGRRSKSFAQKLLDDENLPKLMTENAILVLGHTKRDTLEFPPHWQEIKTLKHGDTVMRFLEYRPSTSAETPAD